MNTKIRNQIPENIFRRHLQPKSKTAMPKSAYTSSRTAVFPKTSLDQVTYPDESLMKYRESLILKLEELCLKTKAPVSVQHLAVTLLDTVNKTQKFGPDQYEGVLFTCLHLAFKFECDDFMVGFSKLAKFSKKIKENDLRKIEIEVLELLNWHIDYRNAYYFIQCFNKYALVSTDEVKKIRREGENVNEIVVHYAVTLASLANRIARFASEESAIIAATCVAFARKKIGLGVIWPSFLSQITGINEKELRVQELEEKYYSVINNAI